MSSQILKVTPWKKIIVRPPKVKPQWHDFECMDCGTPTREYSDPRASMYLCQRCIDARVGRTDAAIPPAIQQTGEYDWWSLWCIEYASMVASGLYDRYGKPQSPDG